jgi:hypothetical protein
MLSNIKKIITIFSYFFWGCLIFSINTKPEEIFNFNNGIIQSTNALRIFIPYCLSLIFIVFAFIFFFKKIKYNKNKLVLFYLLISYFFFQIIGLTLNKETNINNIYLPIFSLGTISFVIISIYYLKFRLNNFLNILIVIIAITSISLSIIFLLSAKEINIFNLYDLIDVSRQILNQSAPRITGLSRMLAITNLYFVAIFIFKSFNLIKKIIYFILITFISLFIICLQSRGTLICYFPCILCLVYLTKSNFKNKINLILILIVFPLLLYFITNNSFYNLSKKNASGSFFLKKETNQRFFIKNDSGRLFLWKYTLKKYNYSKIFGYGPQADRQLIINEDVIKQGIANNVSNGFIYAFLCGGYLSLICYIAFNFLILNKVHKSFSILTKIGNKNNFYYKISLTYLIYFLIRQIFENSFSLFSIDFLIIILCTFIVEENIKNNSSKIF